MTREFQTWSNRNLAALGEGVSIDPSSRVVCRKCGYVYTLGRFHRIEPVQAVYCKGCGSVIKRDGSPLAPPRPQK